MSWMPFVWVVAALLALCRGVNLVGEENGLSTSGYHLCVHNKTRIVSVKVTHNIPYTVTRPCGGWLLWTKCEVRLYKLSQQTEYKTVTEQATRCCDGYEQVGRYCALPVNRSGEFTAKPGSCPTDGPCPSNYERCDWDTDCPGWQKCCQRFGVSLCHTPSSSSNVSEIGRCQFNATVTVKVDYNQLTSKDRGLLNHTRILQATVTGALQSDASVFYLGSRPVHPFRTATSLLIVLNRTLSLHAVTSKLHLLLKHIQEVSSVHVEDVDECAHSALHHCPPRAQCNNTLGSYRCTCHRGYTDDDPSNTGVQCAVDVSGSTTTELPAPTNTIYTPASSAQQVLTGNSTMGTFSSSETSRNHTSSVLYNSSHSWTTSTPYTSTDSTVVSPVPATTCSPPRITRLHSTNVTGTSFCVYWSSHFQANQTYTVVLLQQSEVINRSETYQTMMEVAGLQPAVLYKVTVTPHACGSQGPAVDVWVKTDAHILDATAELTSTEFTSDLKNTSSQAYLNLSESIVKEIYQSLPPDIRVLMDSGQVRLVIVGFSPGSVVVNFTIISAVTLSYSISSVSTSVLHSLMNSSKYTVDENNTRTTDFDECATGENDCSQWANCSNTWGSYTCRCLEGFIDNNPQRPGRACEAIVTTTTSEAKTTAVSTAPYSEINSTGGPTLTSAISTPDTATVTSKVVSAAVTSLPSAPVSTGSAVTHITTAVPTLTVSHTTLTSVETTTTTAMANSTSALTSTKTTMTTTTSEASTVIAAPTTNSTTMTTITSTPMTTMATTTSEASTVIAAPTTNSTTMATITSTPMTTMTTTTSEASTVIAAPTTNSTTMATITSTSMTTMTTTTSEASTVIAAPTTNSTTMTTITSTPMTTMATTTSEASTVIAAPTTNSTTMATITSTPMTTMTTTTSEASTVIAAPTTNSTTMATITSTPMTTMTTTTSEASTAIAAATTNSTTMATITSTPMATTAITTISPTTTNITTALTTTASNTTTATSVLETNSSPMVTTNGMSTTTSASTTNTSVLSTNSSALMVKAAPMTTTTSAPTTTSPVLSATTSTPSINSTGTRTTTPEPTPINSALTTTSISITTTSTPITTSMTSAITSPATTSTIMAVSNTTTKESMKGAISVECRAAAITVTVARDFLQRSQIRETDLFLGLTECGVNGGNATHVQLTVAWNECNTILVSNETYYMVSVILLNNMDSYESDNGTMIVPEVRLRMPIICAYKKKTVLSTDFGSMGYDLIKDIIMASGSFQVIVQLMNGTAPLPHNYSLSSEEAVVVQVSLNTSTEQIKVVMNKCWATPTLNPADSNSYTFLENSCSMNSYTQVLTNGNSSIARVSVQIFSFVSLDMIYLHCLVQICVEMESTTCIPDCLQRTVRSTNTIGRSLGSSGPLLKLYEENLDEKLDMLHLVGFSCLGVGLALFLIFGFVCILFWQRNRIGHYNFNVKPKQDNFAHIDLDT